MANGRKLHELRELRQYLDNEIYTINKQLEAEGSNGASGNWLTEQRKKKQALYDEIDYIIERYGDDAGLTDRWKIAIFSLVLLVSLVLSTLALFR